MKIIIRTGLGMLILAIVLIALSASFMRAHAANVTVASESRVIDAGITHVVLSGPLELDLKQAGTASMQIKGEASMLPRVTSRIEGNTLYLGTRGIIITIRQPLIVELSLPALEKLQLQGSGNGVVRGFRGNRLELQMRGSGNLNADAQYQSVLANSSGSGDLKLNFTNSDKLELSLQGSGNALLSGQTRSLHAKLTGSGDLDSSALKANQVSVNSYGSGDTKVFAGQEIQLLMNGSGDAIVIGAPAKRNVERHGSGDILWQ